jgi:protein-tyrosine phosphatase
MFHAIVFMSVSVGCSHLAITHQGWAWLLTWPASSFALLALAYLSGQPRVLGKKKTGGFVRWLFVVMLPFHVLTGTVWRLACRLTRERSFDELTPGVLVGRRLLPREMPPEVRSIVDLTAEFRVTPTTSQQTLLSVPILDGMAIPAHDLAALAKRISGMPEPIYIHCAQGHGRTGMVAAALLLHRGLADTADGAIRRAQQARPGIGLSIGQRRAVAGVDRLLRQTPRAKIDENRDPS